MDLFSPPNALHCFYDTWKNISHEALGEFHHASYFVLEPRIEWGDNVVVASIEDAEDAGDFRIHLGLPERPDMRSVFVCKDLLEAVRVLTALKSEYPDVPQWFSALDFQTEIKGSDVWAALVAARASRNPTDANCPWVQLAADFEAGKITRISYGDDHRARWLHFFIAAQIGKPITSMPYRDHSGIDPLTAGDDEMRSMIRYLVCCQRYELLYHPWYDEAVESMVEAIRSSAAQRNLSDLEHNFERWDRIVVEVFRALDD